MTRVLRKSFSFFCVAVLTSAAIAAPIASSVRPAIPSPYLCRASPSSSRRFRSIPQR